MLRVWSIFSLCFSSLIVVTLPSFANGFATSPTGSFLSSSFSSPIPDTQRPHPVSTSLNLIGYRNKGSLQKVDEEDGEAKEVGDVKEIPRIWTDGTFTPRGEIDLDVFYPMVSSSSSSSFVRRSSSKPKGAVFFMHGFSQFPVAYAKSLQKTATEANVVVFAVETGLTSSAARGPLFSDQQFWLQRAMSYDTIQLIEMMKDGEFSDIVDRNVPVGLCGHSMGGGLCFYVANQFPNQIDYVFAMAPAYGVAAFDPIAATSKVVVSNSLLLAGSWDLIAPAKKVEQIGANSNKNMPNSSIYGLIKRGLHTGFEDKLVVGSVPLTFLLAIILNLNSFLEFFLLQIASFLRNSTGQLEITDDLMVFFFQQMVAGRKVTLGDASESLEEDQKGKITLSSP